MIDKKMEITKGRKKGRKKRLFKKKEWEQIKKRTND